MGRAYKMKGQKRKKKEEKYDKGEEFEQLEENVTPQPPKKVKTDDAASDKEEKLEPVTDELPGIPIVTVDTNTNKPGVIFILEKASLEIAKVGKTYQLLSSDEHANYLVRNKRNPADYRPDIAFSGDSNNFRQPCQQMWEIESFICEDTASAIAAKAAHYCSCSEKLVDMYDYVGAVNNELDLVFVVGAMAHGKIDEDYVEDYLSISEYPMSAAYCISIITTAVERKWKIL
ncbi:hypothetical protein DH2020_038978 [Rehmannia glutinosa]|uniref:Uncharacterized protein n=1 Tax=Rehmannia glutinosa TaxID=99300 RepID=A0ABR0UZ08_REHGL